MNALRGLGADFATNYPEERRAGTLDWLRAKPLTTWNIVVGCPNGVP